jgi:hypothetical protein
MTVPTNDTRAYVKYANCERYRERIAHEIEVVRGILNEKRDEAENRVTHTLSLLNIAMGDFRDKQANLERKLDNIQNLLIGILVAVALGALSKYMGWF